LRKRIRRLLLTNENISADVGGAKANNALLIRCNPNKLLSQERNTERE
jgi:hypothetical protein